MDFINQIDPNLVATIFTGLATGVIWLYHKARGDKVNTASDLIDQILSGISHELLSEYRGEEISGYLKKAREKFENLIWTILEKRGIKKSPLLEPSVHLGVEKASSWLASEIIDKGNQLAMAKIPSQLDDLGRKVAEIMKTIEEAQAKGLAEGKKFADEMVERVP